MPELTLSQLRTRAEHNPSLSTLEEIALHQLHLTGIRVLATACPRLKIAYVQHNLLDGNAIADLRRCKALTYLNAALNNITEIKGIAALEKLTKLDLTVNFIDLDTLESSLNELCQLVHLKEVYLTGNPCTQWKGYRAYAIATLKQLETLDGEAITRSEKIKAKEQCCTLRDELRELARDKRIEKQRIKEDNKKIDTCEIDGSKPTPYTPEERLRMFEEQQRQEREKEESTKSSSLFEAPEDLLQKAQEKLSRKVLVSELENGEIPTQRNTGRYEFTMKETPTEVRLEVAVPRFLDTSLIDIDIHPRWVQCIIKSKNLLIHTPQEINASASKIERIMSNGRLILIMPLANAMIADAAAAAADNPYANEKFRQPEKISERRKQRDAVNYRNIISKPPVPLLTSATLKRRLASNQEQKPLTTMDETISDDDVPPLE